MRLWSYVIAVALLWLVMVFVYVVVVPGYEQKFTELGMTLPALAEFTINASRFIGTFWYVLFLPIIALITVAALLYRHYHDRKLLMLAGAIPIALMLGAMLVVFRWCI